VHLRTPADLGALIRDRRHRAGLDQATLAERVGVSRQWIIAVERGKPTAPMVLVLRTLDVLGVRLVADGSGPPRGKAGPRIENADLDAIVRHAKARR
jgi:HTH-type transcriptional regulator / antitoxin HipB